MWNGSQKSQYDLGRHLLEYKEQNEVADESIAVSAPWTYAIAVYCEHHIVRDATSEAHPEEMNRVIPTI